MKKMFSLIYFILLVIFVNVLEINAVLPESFNSVSQVGDTIQDECGFTNDDGTPNCFAMPLKKAVINNQDVAVICTQYYNEVPAGQTCTKSDWTNDIRYGVAAIIKESKSSINTTSLTKEYFLAEMAINKFVYDKTSGSGGANIQKTSLSSSKQTLFDNYLEKANSANYENDSKIAISLSSESLTFTLNEDNYESNSITVSGVNEYSVTTKTNIVTVLKTGNTFKIIVPVSAVDVSTTITAVITANKTLELASNYNCGEGYQSLTPVLLDTQIITANKEVSGVITPLGNITINKFDNNNKYLTGAKIKVTGPNNYSNEFTTNGSALKLINLEYGTYTIEEIQTPNGYVTAAKQTVVLDKNNLSKTINLINNKTKVSISKLDATGKKELPGATLEIQDKDGKIVEFCNNKECKWESTDKPYVIEGLPVGTYYLVETIAPKGYVLSKEKVEFTVKDESTPTNVVMKNNLTRIKISKLDATGKKELAGATLEIQDKEGKIVKFCTDDKGNTNLECKWVSTDKPYVIEGLPVGTYYLVETIAPKGYALNKKKVEFEITNSGTEKTIKMKNELRKVRISKVNAVDKNGLAGATLEIQDKEGKIVKFCTDDKGNTNLECKWVSTDKPYVIEGLPVGTYYLVETIAPKGYVLNKEKIEFEIKNDSTIVDVQMVNDLEVDVPDTLSGRSALLLTIAMFDISLGIGILACVKKTKEDN